MARVVLSGSLKAAMPGDAPLDIQATDVRQLLRQLGELCPGIRNQLDEGVTLSIDGQIYNDALFEPIEEDSEVYVMPRLAGG